MGPRQVDHHESSPTRTRDERNRHAQRARHRHGRVDRVATAPEDVDPRPACIEVHRRHRAPGPRRDRTLALLRRVSPVRRRGARDGREQRKKHDRRRGRES